MVSDGKLQKPRLCYMSIVISSLVECCTATETSRHSGGHHNDHRPFEMFSIGTTGRHSLLTFSCDADLCCNFSIGVSNMDVHTVFTR
ncbi:hypothetical protein F4604DRAFT_1731399 [Suillus subluteus]|nr:hypothetical protein F4604DRAFT_1731399 [Suillus subluteus]